MSPKKDPTEEPALPATGGARSAQHPKDQPGVTTAEPKTRTKPKLERPKLYKVLLHNDDYTPMEFVVLVLVNIFHKSESDATSIMLHAHTRGYAVAGVYTFEVAETKVAETLKLAEQAQFPLLSTMEPE
jgi:ATP-dependent Clp protease adaptor protein ClpS